ncbi:MAG: apolipoprotein A1/A4/E family protein [Synergistaceae bacterium]|nr:apolipoprotein A1/A4/E family protein [Synergistaceae bacterium]
MAIMTSGDKVIDRLDRGEYLRADVFDAKMNAFMAEIRLGNEQLRNELRNEFNTKFNALDAKIETLRNELSAKIETFRNELNTKIETLRNELNAKIETFRNELNAKIESVRTELLLKIEGVKEDFNAKINNLDQKIESVNNQLTTRIEILSTRIDGLEARMTDLQYSVSWQFSVVAVIVAVMGIVLGAVIAFAPSIWAFIKRIRHPELLRSELETLVSEQVSNALEKYFSHKTNIGGK